MVKTSFRPVPSSLRATRVFARHREYARFYGSYRSETGKTRRFSFQVKIARSLSNRKKSILIRNVVSNILDRRVPVHKMGQSFSSFRELLRRTTWVRVRRILDYKAGVKYVR
jgi:hypothetical protein